MLIFTHRFSRPVEFEPSYTFYLNAEERTRTRQHLNLDEGQEFYLRLPRGTILQDGDGLQSENGEVFAQIAAKPEPVITVKTNQPSDLIKAAYHLGNRHVPLEITVDYLRFSPDSVLEQMLKQMGYNIVPEVAPFYPESGAYGHNH